LLLLGAILHTGNIAYVRFCPVNISEVQSTLKREFTLIAADLAVGYRI